MTDYSKFDYHDDQRSEPLVCPVCGSVNITAGRFDCSIEQAWRTVTCENPDCGFEWQEEFVFDNWEPLDD